jgi:hypothetical protein
MTSEDTMVQRDIYDDMPDGVAQRRYNQQRLAELERDGASRRVRIAQVVDVAELASAVIRTVSSHLH